MINQMNRNDEQMAYDAYIQYREEEAKREEKIESQIKMCKKSQEQMTELQEATLQGLKTLREINNGD